MIFSFFPDAFQEAVSNQAYETKIRQIGFTIYDQIKAIQQW